MMSGRLSLGVVRFEATTPALNRSEQMKNGHGICVSPRHSNRVEGTKPRCRGATPQGQSVRPACNRPRYSNSPNSKSSRGYGDERFHGQHLDFATERTSDEDDSDFRITPAFAVTVT